MEEQLKQFYKNRRQKRFENFAENIKDFFKEFFDNEIEIKDIKQKPQD